jgi:hypothetical protein
VRRFDEDRQQVISQLAELKGCKMELADLHQHAETLREQVLVSDGALLTPQSRDQAGSVHRIKA